MAGYYIRGCGKIIDRWRRREKRKHGQWGLGEDSLSSLSRYVDGERSSGGLSR